MLRQPVTITVDAVARLAEARRLGLLHPVLESEAVWRDHDGNRAAETQMWQEFERAGLLSPRGQVSDETLETLTVLVRPRVEYVAIVVEPQRYYSVLVAGGTSEAVVAVRCGAHVEIATVVNESLPATLLRQIPDRAPVRNFHPLNVPMDHLAAIKKQPPHGQLPGSPGSRADAQLLAKIGRQRRYGQGELYSGIRDHYGRHRVTPQPIRYHDLRAGRIMILTPPGYLSVLPATKTTLLQQLTTAHRSLTH